MLQVKYILKLFHCCFLAILQLLLRYQSYCGDIDRTKKEIAIVGHYVIRCVQERYDFLLHGIDYLIKHKGVQFKKSILSSESHFCIKLVTILSANKL